MPFKQGEEQLPKSDSGGRSDWYRHKYEVKPYLRKGREGRRQKPSHMSYCPFMGEWAPLT